MIRRTWPVLFLLVFLLLNSPAFGEHMELGGVVVDRQTGSGIPDALVEIENASGGAGYSRMETDVEGGFRFENLPSGVRFHVSVTAQGYASTLMSYWEPGSGTVESRLRIEMHPEGRLGGKITTSQGLPLERARIVLDQISPQPFLVNHFERETDRGGTYRIDGIPQGGYRMVIQKEGFLNEEFRNVFIASGKDEEMNVVLYAPASISGRVRLDDGETPLFNIAVTAVGPVSSLSNTNPDGEYLVENLKPGLYSVTAASDGFRPQKKRIEIHVGEGETVEGVELLLSAEPSQIRIAIYQDVYTLNEPVKFVVRAFNLPGTKIRIYEIPEQAWATDRSRFERLLAGKDDLSGLKQVHESSMTFSRFRPFSWVSREVTVESPLTPGAYLLQVATDGVEARHPIFISNLGIAVLRGKDDLLIYAMNLETNRAEPGANVFVLNREKTESVAVPNISRRILDTLFPARSLRQGVTDDSGLLRLKGIQEPSVHLLALKRGVGLAVTHAFLTPYAATGGRKVLIYTDRPVYRPGHEAHFKALVKEFREGVPEPAPQGKSITVTLRDPDGKGVFTGEFVTDDWGCVYGSIPLSADARLGTYELFVDGFASGRSVFSVQAYRKPDFQVRVTTDHAAYVTGDRVQARVEARYFLGLPLKNAPIEYRVYETLRSRPETTAWWEASYYDSAGYQTVIKHGRGTTDAQGFFAFDFLPGPKSYDRTLTIEADVTAPSGRVEDGRAETAYERSRYRVKLGLGGSVFRTGESPRLTVRVANQEGDPVERAKVRVSLEQETWDPVRRRYERGATPVWSRIVETGVGGKAELQVPLEGLESGKAQLTAATKDSSGNPAASRCDFWTFTGTSFNASYDYPALDLFLDKDAYRPGDKARLVLHSSVPQAEVLLTFEGETLLSYQRLVMKEPTRILEIPVEESFAPNVHISALLHDGKKLHYRRISLNVPVESGDFNLSAAFDREEYAPGDPAEVVIRCTGDDGKPVNADMSLAVVDEAVYRIAEDRTPDPADFFYALRPPWFSLTYSFPLRFIGGATKDRGDLRARTNFKDTALWIPNLRTGTSETVSAAFTMPDNLTTWRATILGHTKEGRFALERTRTLSSKPLAVSLKPPRFLVAGDRMEVSAVLVNRTEEPLETAYAMLTPEAGVELLTEPRRSVSLPAGGTARTSWVLSAEDAASARMTVRGGADGMEDSERRDFPIADPGIPLRVGISGRIEGDSGQASLLIPEDASLRRAAAEISVTPHPALAAFSAVPYLTAFPYGCAEQTLNAFLPVAVYLSTLNALGLEVQTEAALIKNLEEGLGRLQRFINYDGEVSWGPYSDPDPYLTALAYFSLLRAVDLLGLDGTKKSLDRGAGLSEEETPLLSGLLRDHDGLTRRMEHALIRFLEAERRRSMQLFILLALTEGEYRDPKTAGDLALQLDAMDPMELGMAIPVWKRHGMELTVQLALNKLKSFAVETPHGVHFALSDQQTQDVDLVEQNAFCLMALTSASPEDPLVDSLTNWILAQRRGLQWHSTRASGLCLLALSRVFASDPNLKSFQGGSLRVTVNGKELGEFQLSPETLKAGVDPNMSIPVELFHAGNNEIRFQGQKLSRVYYAVQVDAHDRRIFGDPFSEGCAVYLDKELHIGKRVLDSQNRPRILPADLSEGIHPGDEVLVRVSFTPDRDYRYFLLEDYLPAGFETVDFESSQEVSWWPVYAWKERHDRRVAFFFPRLREGEEVSLEYVIRAESPGMFLVKPAVLSDFYTPDIRAVSRSSKIEVQR